MKGKTSEEFGKGLINFANLIGGLSLMNSFFGATYNVPIEIISVIIIYSVILLYITGLIFINKGSE